MNFWEKITGSDMKRELRSFDQVVKKLPADYQAAWEEINDNLWLYADFTGRNLMPIVEGCLACSKKRRRTVRVSKRFWVTISKASVQRWPAKKGKVLS